MEALITEQYSRTRLNSRTTQTPAKAIRLIMPILNVSLTQNPRVTKTKGNAGAKKNSLKHCTLRDCVQYAV